MAFDDRFQAITLDKGNEVLIEKRHGDSVIHFIIKQMILYFPNPAQTEMLNKCKTIFSNIYQYQLWTDVLIRSGIYEPLRLVVLVTSEWIEERTEQSSVDP